MLKFIISYSIHCKFLFKKILYNFNSICNKLNLFKVCFVLFYNYNIIYEIEVNFISMNILLVLYKYDKINVII